MRKLKVSDGPEPRLTLYSSLISHFRTFRKQLKNQCKNGCFLMARNHVWRYTLRLFHTFALFEKNRKIDAKRHPESHVFWLEKRPSGHKARLTLQFWSFLGDLKNHWFFNVTGERPKIYKIEPWSVQGLKRIRRGSHDGTRFRRKCPRAGPARVLSDYKYRFYKKRFPKYRFYKNRL